VPDPITLLVTLGIIIPSCILVISQSSFIVDYAIFVIAFNRLIRRMIDYNNGFFNPYSTISLTPLVVCGLIFVGFVLRVNRTPLSERILSSKAIKAYSIALGLAFIVGLYRTRLAAVHALGDYLAPLGLLGYGILYCHDERTIDRWCRSIVIACVGVAAYGIWQFYTIPPWDAFWLIEAGMEGYMGTPEAMKMTLFSSMQERGPVSMFLVAGIFVLLFRSGIVWIKWPAIACMLAALLLTSVRTSFVQLSIAVVIFPLINRGISIFQTAVVAILLTIIVSTFIESVPGFTQVSDRLSTLKNLPDDGSVQGRIQLFSYAVSNSTSEPLGTGLGSMGLSATRISTGGSSAIPDSSGYMSLLQTFGWIGFILIVSMMWRIWSSSGIVLSIDAGDQNAQLLRTWFVSGIAALLAGDWLFTASFFWVIAGYCLGIADAMAVPDEDRSEPNSEPLPLANYPADREVVF
jgi:putative inorganic carbon (HCO3(-)) transporter